MLRTCTMIRGRFLSIAASMVVAHTLVACSSETSKRPEMLGDCEGVGCRPTETSGASSPVQDASRFDTRSADSDASLPAARIGGRVVRIVDDAFSRGSYVTGAGSIEIATTAGVRRIDYLPGSGGAFVAEDALVGPNWFHVRPSLTMGAESLFVTYALLDVPKEGAMNLEVPAIDRDMLSAIYARLPRTVVLNGTQSQVVLAFETKGQRRKGIQLTQVPTREFTLYDSGGGFEQDARSTGSRGLAILGNVWAGGLVRWQSESGVTGSVFVVAQAGEASFVRVEVP